jgi:hypothetical protein
MSSYTSLSTLSVYAGVCIHCGLHTLWSAYTVGAVGAVIKQLSCLPRCIFIARGLDRSLLLSGSAQLGAHGTPFATSNNNNNTPQPLQSNFRELLPKMRMNGAGGG